jgi:hypothetical protein
VPWRFLDVGSLRVWKVSGPPASKNLHSSGRSSTIDGRAQSLCAFVGLTAK